MKLSELNEWLSLIANVGVLAGIIFLAIEIQQNTNVVRTAAYNDTVKSFNEWRYAVISDPEALAHIAEYRGVEDVNELKKSMLINSQWAIYEQAFYAYRYGLMEDNEWGRFKGAACTNFRRVMSQDLPDIAVSSRLTEEFWNYVSANC